MASDDQMWQPPMIGLATTGIAKPMITANGQTPAPVVYHPWAPPDDDPMRLHPDDIEAIARRVAELLKAAP